MSRSLQISIADDEPTIRMFLARLLTLWGHRVVSVSENGQDLVEQCRTLKPDLVITDIAMPVLDGIDAAMQICETQSIPVIVISGHPELIERSRKTNIRACLLKPVQMNQLQAAITTAMAPPGTAEAAAGSC
jgi:response regulator NasT